MGTVLNCDHTGKHTRLLTRCIYIKVISSVRCHGLTSLAKVSFLYMLYPKMCRCVGACMCSCAFVPMCICVRVCVQAYCTRPRQRDVKSSIFEMFVHKALPIAIAHDRTLVPVVLIVKCRGL